MKSLANAVEAGSLPSIDVILKVTFSHAMDAVPDCLRYRQAKVEEESSVRRAGMIVDRRFPTERGGRNG